MQEHAITSDDALVLDEIPGSTIVIVGAGYISVEFSSIYKGLGANVHLMYRKPLPLTVCPPQHCLLAYLECMQIVISKYTCCAGIY